MEEASGQGSSGGRDGNISTSVDYAPPDSSADTSMSTMSILASDGTAKPKTMPSDELLATIIEMRLAGHSKDKTGSAENGKTSTAPSSLDTLDMCHKSLQDIPDEMVEVIRDEVVRLALGYNFIYTLPRNFSKLSRLRYLNIRSNILSTFPEMLAEMPSLEILDISRNKIRKLPSEPGQLVNLRVLCISHNRLRRLPTWMIQLRHLRILKIDDNPIQWPPPHISILPPISEEAPLATANKGVQSPDEKEKAKASERAMQLWIVRMKRWMKENAAQEDERERQRLLPHSSREAGGEIGPSRGHARGKSSMASGSSVVASATAHIASPSQAQRNSPSRGQPPDDEELRRGTNNSFDPYDSSTTTEQVDSSGADESTSTMSGTVPFTASPERGFRMRPLMLIRTASGRVNPRSASAGSPSGPDSAVGEWESTVSTAPSTSTIAATDHIALNLQRNQSSNQSDSNSIPVDSESREHAVMPSTRSLPEISPGLPSASVSIASLYSVQSMHDNEIPGQHQAGSAELLNPLQQPSPSRSVTPTPQNKEPIAPTPDLTSTSGLDTDTEAGQTPLMGYEDTPGVSSKAANNGGPQGASALIDDLAAPPSMSRPTYGHGRTQSHSSGKHMEAEGPVGSGSASGARGKMLSSKQSLPDLRASRFTALNMARESSIPTSSSSSQNVSSSGSTNGVASNSGTTVSSSRAMASSTSSGESQPPMPVRRRPVAMPINTALPSAATPLANRGESFASAPPSTDVSQKTVDPEVDTDATAQATPKAAALAGLPPDRTVSVRRAALLDAAGLSKEGLTSPSLPRTPTKTASRDSLQQQHERDSYFRRLSTFPSTLVASSCPPSVLKVIDASRGILFALSQIYTALKQYILFCTDERICAQIQRVLDVAADTLAKLIDSLDRFDSLALKGQNSPGSVAAVTEASRDSVITFRQVVSVLQLQLANLLKSADLRYTRSLMVMLYGATVEVSTSWEEFSRQREGGHALDLGAQLTQEHRGYGYPSPLVNGHLLTNGSLASGHLPSIAEGLSPQSAKSAMGETPSPARPTEMQLRPQARREGGSFTAQDFSADGTAAAPSLSVASPVHVDRASHSKETSMDWAPDTPSRHRGANNRRRDGLMAGSAGLPTAASFASLPTKALPQAGQEKSDQVYTLAPPPAGVASSAPPGSTRFAMGDNALDNTGPMYSVMNGRDGSGLLGTPANGAASDAHGALFRPPMIDHHLLSLVQQVTSAASGVWTTLFDHLSSLGINGQAAASVNGVFSPETTPILGPNRVGGLSRSGTTKGPMSSSSGVGSASGGDLLKPARDEKSTRAVSPSPSAANSTGPSTTAPHPHSQSARKLNVLREHCLSAADLTKRLQHTLEKVQDDLDSQNPEGPSIQGVNGAGLGAGKSVALSALVSPVESRRLVDDSIAFVKAVTNLLVQIKTLSISHDTLTAPDLRKVLAGLATGCSNLSVHLHFCAPRGPAVAPSGSYRPGAGDEGGSRRQVFAGGDMNGHAAGMARRKEQDGSGARGGSAMAQGESQGSGHATSRSASSAASLQQQTHGGQQQQQQYRQVPALPTRM